jgi:hypothetical protein
MLRRCYDFYCVCLAFTRWYKNSQEKPETLKQKKIEILDQKPEQLQKPSDEVVEEVIETPSMATETPGIATETPSIATEAPGIATEVTTMTWGSPSITTMPTVAPLPLTDMVSLKEVPYVPTRASRLIKPPTEEVKPVAMTTHTTRIVQEGRTGSRLQTAPTVRSQASPLADDPRIQCLPSESIATIGRRLVGLEGTQNEVIWYLCCYFDRQIEAWAEKTGQSIPVFLQETFHASVPLFIFNGDPGTGKSVLSRVIADTYCRHLCIPGSVLTVGTETRGNGLVGSFSKEVRRAFDELASLPTDGLRVLIIEEADAIVMRRSEVAGHQEDRAATSTILQCLDSLPDGNRFLIILTTNRIDAIDPALQRRCTQIYTFPRPNPEARKALLTTWLSDLPDGQMLPLISASDGMTPRDLERCLQSSYISAIQQGREVALKEVEERLTKTPRTQTV